MNQQNIMILPYHKIPQLQYTITPIYVNSTTIMFMKTLKDNKTTLYGRIFLKKRRKNNYPQHRHQLDFTIIVICIDN